MQDNDNYFGDMVASLFAPNIFRKFKFLIQNNRKYLKLDPTMIHGENLGQKLKNKSECSPLHFFARFVYFQARIFKMLCFGFD